MMGRAIPLAALDELEKALEICERYGYAQIFDDSPRAGQTATESCRDKNPRSICKALLIIFQSMDASKGKLLETAPKWKRSSQPGRSLSDASWKFSDYWHLVCPRLR